MRRFFRILYVVTAAGQVPFAVAVAGLLGRGAFGPVLGVLALLAVTLAIPGRVRLASSDRPMLPVRRALERAYYAHWGGGIASAPLFAIGLAVGLPLGSPLTTIASGAYALGLALGVFAVFVRARSLRVRTLEIEVPSLPNALDGYRIAQLSDLHVGSLLPASVARRWIEAANAAEPDLVALTGDYVTTGTDFHVEAARLMGELRARDGVFAVLGNHDNHGGCEPLRGTMLEVGIRLLQNERAVVARGGVPLFEIAGVDDVYTGRANVAKTFEGYDRKLPALTLAHDPKSFPAIAENGSFLVLSGHTHWGQVAVPLRAKKTNLASPFFRFSADVYEQDGAKLYVHPGLGTTGPPIRFGVVPEVTLIVLRARRA